MLITAEGRRVSSVYSSDLMMQTPNSTDRAIVPVYIVVVFIRENETNRQMKKTDTRELEKKRYVGKYYVFET